MSEYVDVSTIGLSTIPPHHSPLPSDPAKATQSYWLATTPPHLLPTPAPTPISSSGIETQTDVAIIGSGITGVSFAYHLLHLLPSLPPSTSPSNNEKGAAIRGITIFEAREFSSGATGRNGGHLTAVSALAYSDLASNPNHLLGSSFASLSAEEVKVKTGKAVGEILCFEQNTADAIRKLIADERVEEEVGFTDESNWHLCFEQEEVEAFESSLKQASEHVGLQEFVGKVRRVEKDEVDRRMNKPNGVKAVYEIPGATLHPRALVCVIYRAAERVAREKGIALKLYTHCPVHKVTPTDSGSTLTTTHGEITAKYVVHATNGYVSHLIPSLSDPVTGITPTRAQVIAIPPSTLVHWGMGLSAGGGYEYGHQRPPSESSLYIFGGGREFAPSREWGIADDSSLNPTVSKFLYPYMPTVFPESYGKSKVEKEWTGIMGYTLTKDPLVGPVEGREGKEWIAAGYSGHGMTRAWGCARTVAEMLVAEGRGENWRWRGGRGGLPWCYLTKGAREEEKVVGERERVDEKECDKEEEMKDKVGQDERSAGCC